jgi:hypothetical protein
MIFALWCRLTGGHVWSPPAITGVSICDRCGSLRFGPVSWDALAWDRFLAAIAADIKAGRITLPEPAKTSEGGTQK